MISKLHRVLLITSSSLFFIACGNTTNSDSAPSFNVGDSMSAEAQAIIQTSENIEKMGTDSSGLLLGASDITASPFHAILAANNKTTSFDHETSCLDYGRLRSLSDSGSPKYDPTDPLFPLYNIYCNIMVRTDGPDTIRGAIDRTTGFMCALGNINYDGVKRTKKLAITTKCFSQQFVDTVRNEFGVSSIDAQVQAFPNVTTGKAPAAFNKFIELRAILNHVDPAESKTINYDIAVKITNTERAVALLDTEGVNEASAFAFYMNKSTGTLKIEGHNFRAGSFERSVRYNVQGTLDDSFKLSNINLLQAIADENSANHYTSLSGPKTGRMVRSTAHVAGDGECYPMAGCTGNTGIAPSSTIYETPSTWFAADSYLGAHSDIHSDGSWN